MSATLSIITITYQAEQYLERTLKSVVEQGHADKIEYIIVDGASTDGTLAIINTHKAHINHFISEKDKGIYDAMNKGIALATGDYLLFMNAGDCFASPSTLTHMLHALAKNPDVLAGDALFVNTQNEVLGLRSEVTPHRLPETLTWHSFQKGMVICHQSFIVKRSIAPPFNLAFALSSDIDWEINCLKKSTYTLMMHEPVCRYLMGGASVQNLRKSWIERFAVLRAHFGLISTISSHAIIILRGVYFALQKRGKYW